MKRTLAAILLALILTSFAACDTTPADTSRDSSVSSDIAVSDAESVASEEPSEAVSEEPSLPAVIYDETTAQPKVIGCTRVENNIFVIIGTCESGATVTAKVKNKTYSSQSDHGYFSIRVNNHATSVNLELTAQTEGKNASEVMKYTARPKAVGKDQWHIIAGGNYQFHLEYSLNDYLRNNTYNDNQLKALTNRLKSRSEKLKSDLPDSEIIYMIVPSPATTYPETMPANYVPQKRASRLEQVTEAITNAGIKVIDLRPAFEEHKNDEYKLYWKTDSHWNDYGSFIAYTELFNYISEKHPECAPRTFDEFNWAEDYYLGGDIATYLEYYGINGYASNDTPMREYNVLRTPKFEMPSQISSIRRYVSDRRLTYDPSTVQNQRTVQTNRPELPSALVMRDSYSSQLYDILAERFDTTWYKSMWDYSFSNNEMKQKKPDYIIYILVERNIDSIFG